MSSEIRLQTEDKEKINKLFRDIALSDTPQLAVISPEIKQLAEKYAVTLRPTHSLDINRIKAKVDKIRDEHNRNMLNLVIRQQHVPSDRIRYLWRTDW